MSCYDLCRPCGPTPLANSCNEPCVRHTNEPCVVACGDSRVIIYPPPVVVTFPGPILTTYQQQTVVGASGPSEVALAEAPGAAPL
ncbi:KRFB protein, partial [Cnemophilus loriae]|nr:KRFB protein [Cnemophilus loriae]